MITFESVLSYQDDAERSKKRFFSQRGPQRMTLCELNTLHVEAIEMPQCLKSLSSVHLALPGTKLNFLENTHFDINVYKKSEVQKVH